MELLAKTLAAIAPQDAAARTAAKARLDQLIMPHWAMGRVLDLAMDLAGITGTIKPPVARKAIITMAGDHGVVAEGVSVYPQEVTPQMVHGFVAGGAGINALARLAGARVVVVDMDIAGDLSALVEAGIEVVEQLADEVDVFGTGDMGIGNTTPSTAILAALTGMPVAEVTGRGTGIDDKQFLHKVQVVLKALKVNAPDPTDGLDVLAKVGGFEIGGIAGVVLAAAARRKPVVVDGFISTAGAMIAHALCPASAQYIVAAHRSVEAGHRAMARHLGKEPLLDLSMRLGEGTGAALAMNIVEAAARVLTEVATFEEASVSKAHG